MKRRGKKQKNTMGASITLHLTIKLSIVQKINIAPKEANRGSTGPRSVNENTEEVRGGRDSA